MADLTLTVTNRTIAFPQTVPQQITNTEYIDRVKFDCDSEYTGYSLVALFKNGTNGKVFPVAVPSDRGFVDIDPRALRRKGYLYIGMYGLNGLKVLPTLWATPIEIKEGVDTSATEDPSAPVPSVYAALVARVDALETAVDELEDDVGALTEDVGDLENSVEALEDDVDALDVAVDELDEDVEELQTTVDGKQDIIPDLDDIRSGAALGATALQSVPNTYRTASAQDALIDANYKTAATSATAPAWSSDEKTAACIRIGSARKLAEGWTLVGTITTADGISVDLTGKTELIIYGDAVVSSGSVSIKSSIGSLTSGNFSPSYSKAYFRFENSPIGIDCVIHVIGVSLLAVNGSGYNVIDKSISQITWIKVDPFTNVTSCNVKVYAR